MSLFHAAREVHVSGGQFTGIGGDQNIHYANSLSVFDVLKQHTAFNAAYNSGERESEYASMCQEGTRKDVLGKLSAWCSENTGYPVCWLEGPAGSGKSTIAHTIAKQCDDNKRLAFSFFFSRGKQDRSHTTKFVPTFAYQLARFFPAMQPLLHRALADDPSTPHLCLRDQFEKLILGPCLATPTPTSMIVVVDGLDECSDDDLLKELIRLLIDTTTHLPFRFLFISRPEPHIQQTFQSLWTKHKTYFLSLRDFGAHSDICNFLQRHFSKIRDQNHHVMRDVPRPWPSLQELEVLVQQSDGLFIYVSTLVKFVADKRGLPQEKLQAVMKTHTGVDRLYNQVLSAAQEYDYFEQVIGTIIYLRSPLPVIELGQILRLQSSHIRMALSGCQSVFAVPHTDEEEVRPYHASLSDFLTDPSRAGGHFCNPQVYHVSILVGCLQLIGLNENNGGGKVLTYACQNWCYHFSLALSHYATVGSINANCDVVMLMMKMEHQWMRIWMYGLESLSGVNTICSDCESVLAKMAETPAQWTSVIKSLEGILNVARKLLSKLVRVFALDVQDPLVGFVAYTCL